MQSARFFDPKADSPAPMVVALHSWSGDYTQQLHEEIEKWCVENGWAFMHPASEAAIAGVRLLGPS